jgi:hypothetical protein
MHTQHVFSGAAHKLPILRLKKTGEDDDSFEKQASLRAGKGTG